MSNEAPRDILYMYVGVMHICLHVDVWICRYRYGSQKKPSVSAVLKLNHLFNLTSSPQEITFA